MTAVLKGSHIYPLSELLILIWVTGGARTSKHSEAERPRQVIAPNIFTSRGNLAPPVHMMSFDYGRNVELLMEIPLRYRKNKQTSQ